ncbi:MAG: extracellular solute-binding protein [Candidatus Latescibacterota bacterium]
MKRVFSRRWVATAATAALACALALGSCGGGEEGTTIRFWQFWDVGVIQPMVDRFEAEHPGVRVEVEQLTWKSGLEKIQAALASGTQPDVCELGSTWLPRFSYEGVLADLTGIYEAEADSFLMWESAIWDGRVYGLPWVQGSRVLFYNRDLFERAGLDPNVPPATWSDLLATARAIDGLGDDISGFGLNLGERYVLYKKFMAFAWGNGGRILDDNGDVALDQPETIEALEYYVDLSRYSLKEKQEVLDHHFKSGKLGMQISGAWNIRNYSLEAPGLEYGVSLVPRPDDDGTHASFAGAEMLVVFERSQVKELGIELARFLHSYPQSRELSLAVGSVFPAEKRALRDTVFVNDARVRVFIEQSFSSRTAPAHPGWIEMEDVINNAIEEALYGRRAPRWCLDDAADKIETITERFERNRG